MQEREVIGLEGARAGGPFGDARDPLTVLVY